MCSSDLAWKTAAKQDKMFLVEGAPDCMRLQSIGIYNTVAALGSAWNETHFSTIERIASKVCFLPDADPPKNGEVFGHGIQVVMEAGTLAMENGLSVSIKEIPDTDDNKKQDPDTFFKNTNIFNATDETDFILWMADKLFPQTNTTEEQRLTIKKIATKNKDVVVSWVYTWSKQQDMSIHEQRIVLRIPNVIPSPIIFAISYPPSYTFVSKKRKTLLFF